MSSDRESDTLDGASSRSRASQYSRRSSYMQNKVERIICVEDADSINIEFVYYTAMLKKFASNLSREKDKEKVIPWIRKLYAAEYATEFFKVKRNRYLFTMILSILNDEMYGVFKSTPPAGPLKKPESFAVLSMPLTTWELDNMWEEMLNSGGSESTFACGMHAKCIEEENAEDEEEEQEENAENLAPEDGNEQAADAPEGERRKPKMTKSKKAIYSSLLDWEFQYLLHIARPYAALMTTVQDKTRVAKWLQKLCGIRMDIACSKMKGIRNDYMMALLGYLYDLRLTGPFEQPPPTGPLEHLDKVMEKLKDSYPLTVPAQNDVNEFLSEQPTPAEGGAFCYIAISGDLQATNLIKSKPVKTNDCSK